MKPQPPGAAQPDETADAYPRLCLSALADGETQDDPQAVSRACGLLRDDPEARQTWHRWHLIGDVLRSEELAQDPARDAAFVAALRVRLAAEPVVLAPGLVASAPVPRRRAWLAPAAVAAGFVAVAGVLVVARTGLPEAPSPVGVQALVTPPGAAPASAAAEFALASETGATAPVSQAGAALIRDPRLDSYLRAHQAARGGLAAAVPGGGMRNVDVLVTPGAER